MLFGIGWDTTNNFTMAWSILPILLRGMVVTIQATLLGFVVAAILGLVLAALKSVRSRIISWPATILTEFLRDTPRSEEHTSELQSLMRISYAVFCLKKKKHHIQND